TGTTSFRPRYPMIPHITEYLWDSGLGIWDWLRSAVTPHSRCNESRVSNPESLIPALLFSPRDPPVNVSLLAGADRKRAGGDVLANRRPAADICALADRHRRDQLRVAADERAVLDGRLVLVDADVVARVGASAEV